MISQNSFYFIYVYVLYSHVLLFIVKETMTLLQNLNGGVTRELFAISKSWRRGKTYILLYNCSFVQFISIYLSLSQFISIYLNLHSCNILLAANGYCWILISVKHTSINGFLFSDRLFSRSFGRCFGWSFCLWYSGRSISRCLSRWHGGISNF